jgi:hypothetical protein
MNKGGQALPGGTERSFGLSVGGFLCLISALLAWRGRMLRAEVIGSVGGVLVLLGALWPGALKHPNVWWWRFARTLGYINARVILTVLFVIVLVPLGLLWRMTGKDPLARRRSSWPGWSPYPARYRDRRHYERMY